MKCPSPIESVSPSPDTPMYPSRRLAAFAPVATEGMRPCTELKPCDPATKYAVVLEEQPMPDSLTRFFGSIALAQLASTMAAVIESWPQPAHSVELAPS